MIYYSFISDTSNQYRNTLQANIYNNIKMKYKVIKILNIRHKVIVYEKKTTLWKALQLVNMNSIKIFNAMK